MKKRKARAPRRRPAPSRPKRLSVAELIRATALRLKRAKLVFAHGTSDPVAEAAFLVGETLGIHPDHVDARAGMTVAAAQQKRISALIERRIRTRKPAAYLLNRIYMRGVPFYIDERAIVPRSYLGEILDSETFTGESFSLLPDADSIGHVLDLCTGSGCLAILAALRFPRAKVDAVELSKDAIEVARRNVADHRLKKRVRLLRGDLFAPLKRRATILLFPIRLMSIAKAWWRCRRNAGMSRNWLLTEAATDFQWSAGFWMKPAAISTRVAAYCARSGAARALIERAYPDKRFLWLDTEASSGEVFWLDADQLR